MIGKEGGRGRKQAMDGRERKEVEGKERREKVG